MVPLEGGSSVSVGLSGGRIMPSSFGLLSAVEGGSSMICWVVWRKNISSFFGLVSAVEGGSSVVCTPVHWKRYPRDHVVAS